MIVVCKSYQVQWEKIIQTKMEIVRDEQSFKTIIIVTTELYGSVKITFVQCWKTSSQQLCDLNSSRDR